MVVGWGIERLRMRVWVLDEAKGFSFKSFYQALSIYDDSFPSRFIWNRLAPTKISFLCGCCGGIEFLLWII